MKYLLFLLFFFSVFAVHSQNIENVSSVDTIKVERPNFLGKKQVIYDATQDYKVKAAKYFHKSGYFRGAALVSAVGAGVAWWAVENSDNPFYAAPITLAGIAVICEAVSIHYQMKGSKMLSFSAGPQGAKIAVNF